MAAIAEEAMHVSVGQHANAPESPGSFVIRKPGSGFGSSASTRPAQVLRETPSANAAVVHDATGSRKVVTPAVPSDTDPASSHVPNDDIVASQQKRDGSREASRTSSSVALAKAFPIARSQSSRGVICRQRVASISRMTDMARDPTAGPSSDTIDQKFEKLRSQLIQDMVDLNRQCADSLEAAQGNLSKDLQTLRVAVQELNGCVEAQCSRNESDQPENTSSTKQDIENLRQQLEELRHSLESRSDEDLDRTIDAEWMMTLQTQITRQSEDMNTIASRAEGGMESLRNQHKALAEQLETLRRRSTNEESGDHIGPHKMQMEELRSEFPELVKLAGRQSAEEVRVASQTLEKQCNQIHVSLQTDINTFATELHASVQSLQGKFELMELTHQAHSEEQADICQQFGLLAEEVRTSIQVLRGTFEVIEQRQQKLSDDMVEIPRQFGTLAEEVTCFSQLQRKQTAEMQTDLSDIKAQQHGAVTFLTKSSELHDHHVVEIAALKSVCSNLEEKANVDRESCHAAVDTDGFRIQKVIALQAAVEDQQQLHHVLCSKVQRLEDLLTSIAEASSGELGGRLTPDGDNSGNSEDAATPHCPVLTISLDESSKHVQLQDALGGTPEAAVSSAVIEDLQTRLAREVSAIAHRMELQIDGVAEELTNLLRTEMESFQSDVAQLRAEHARILDLADMPAKLSQF